MTQAIVREYLEYSQATGHLTWKTKKHSRKVVVGNRAGSISTNNRHRVIKFLGIVYAEHRLIWLHQYGVWPIGHIDHVDHNEQHNHLKNLRDVTQFENNINSSKRRDNTTGHVGVWINKLNTRKKFMAELNWKGERMHYSSHYSLEAAIKARKNAELFYGFHINHGIDKPMESSTTIKSGRISP
jgi:hypothetical protein